MFIKMLVTSFRAEGKTYKIVEEKVLDSLGKRILKIQGKTVIIGLSKSGVIIVIPHGKYYAKELFEELTKES